MTSETEWQNATPWPVAGRGRAGRPPVPKLEVFHPINLQGEPVPERRWIVDDWIPHGQVSLLGGPGGLGKSLLGMQLATACSTGRPWLGLPTLACRAVGVFCEDSRDELHRRQVDINNHYQIDFADLADLDWVPRFGMPNLLAKFGEFGEIDASAFYGHLLNHADDFGAGLIVLDSLHDLFGSNENSRPQARQFIGLLRDLAMEIDGAVVLVYHPSLSGISSGSGMAGSTAWDAACRQRLYLSEPQGIDDDGPSDDRLLTTKKANYAGRGRELRLRYQDGVFVPLDEPGGVVASIRRHNCEDAFMAMLDKVTAEGRQVSESKHSGNFAPRFFERRPGNDGFTKRDFARAMEQLFADGRIRVEGYGRQGDRRHRIVRAEEAAGGRFPCG